MSPIFTSESQMKYTSKIKKLTAQGTNQQPPKSKRKKRNKLARKSRKQK